MSVAAKVALQIRAQLPANMSTGECISMTLIRDKEHTKTAFVPMWWSGDPGSAQTLKIHTNCPVFCDVTPLPWFQAVKCNCTLVGEKV